MKIRNLSHIWETKMNEKIDLDGVTRAAVHREIRKVEQRTEEQERKTAKVTDLATYKTELLLRVQDHVNDLEKMQCKQDDVHLFKQELLSKASEHLAMLEASSTKKAEIEKFKSDMMKRAQERMAEAEEAQRKAAETATFKDEMVMKAGKLTSNTIAWDAETSHMVERVDGAHVERERERMNPNLECL